MMQQLSVEEGNGGGSVLTSIAKPSPRSSPTLMIPLQQQHEPEPKQNSTQGTTSSCTTIRPDPMKDNSNNYLSSITRDACRCRHLEECMFPRTLSLNCKQMDDFCIGRVDDDDDNNNTNTKKNLGRVYIEALHLRQFLKSPESIIAERNATIKRGHSVSSSSSPSPKKKNRSSSPSKQSRDKNDTNRLSQEFLGGFEGKRTWFVANDYQNVRRELASVKKSKPVTDDEALDYLLSAEIKLVSTRHSMGLNDRTIPPGVDELTMLEKLVKPIPHSEVAAVEQQDKIAEPSLTSNMTNSGEDASNINVEQSANDDGKMPNDEAPAVMSLTTTDGPPQSQPMDVDDTNEDKSNEIIAPLPFLSNNNCDKSIDEETGVKTGETEVLPSSKEELPFNVLEREIQSSDEKKLLKDNSIKSRQKDKFDRAMLEGKEASLAANNLLESFRRNRRAFWRDQKLNSGKAFTCAWCPTNCIQSNKAKEKSSNFESGVIQNDCASSELDNDVHQTEALFQCLECGLVGCSPLLPNKESSDNQHAILHFLMSGHKFGVTCGSRGELFCMGCGDFVYHECFDQERERLFLEQNHPSLSWSETPIIRGVDPSSFIVTPENGIVWRGMMATYPSPIRPELAQSGRFAINRISLFRGDKYGSTMELGPKAVELSTYQQCHCKLRRCSCFLLMWLCMEPILTFFVISTLQQRKNNGYLLACTIWEILAI